MRLRIESRSSVISWVFSSRSSSASLDFEAASIADLDGLA
jgi:hypothetical protein